MAKYLSLNQNEYASYQVDNEAYDYGSDHTAATFQAIGGQYCSTLPTYTDGDSVLLHFTSDGRLMVDTELTLEATNVEINNIKVFSSDGTAVNGKYCFAMTDAGAADGTKHWAGVGGYDATNSKFAHLRVIKGDAAANAGYHVSVAGEVVDFDTGAGTDFTPCMGVLGASAGGTKVLYLVSDDSAMDATPTMLPVGGEYRLAATTYTDGDATVLQTDVNGYLKVATAGVSKYENASYAETEDEANDSEFTTSVLYGTDTEAAAGSKLRAVQVAVDNAGISGTPNILTTGGIYKNALDTYDDNDAVPFHFDVNGRLITAVELNDYIDDSGFTVASDKMLAIGGVATSDSVDSGDTGAFRMTLARNLGVDITTHDGSAWAVNNAINTTIGDGTTVPVVETSGTKKALNVNVTDGTNDMPTMDAAGRQGYVAITDGTDTVDVIDVGTTNTGLPVGLFDADGNRMPSGDAVGRRVYIQHTDGTNSTPSMDTAGRSGYVRITDGTNTQPTGDAVARRIYVQHTDGTNSTPSMDANTRAGFIKITDGSNELSIDGSGYAQVDIAAQTLTAVKVSKDSSANAFANPIFVQPAPVTSTATGTTAGVTVGATTTVVLAALATRRKFVLVNDSNEDIYIGIGANAAMNQGIRLNAAGGCYESTPEDCSLAVNAICTSGGKNLCVQSINNS